MKCPKCGYKRRPNDSKHVPATECPACGIVYAKSESSSARPRHGATSLLSKPSPVDPDSLKKARERVEMRLRRRLEQQLKDERHALTLERARRIAALEAERRKARRSLGSPAPVRTTAESSAAGKATEEKHPILDLVHVVPEHATTSYQPSPPDTQLTRSATQAQTESVSQTEAETITPKTIHATPKTEPEIRPKPVIKSAPLRVETPPEVETETQNAMEETAVQTEAQDHRPGQASGKRKLRSKHKKSHWQPYTGKLFARLLPATAWLILVAGVVGAVLSWTTLKSAAATVAPSDPMGFNGLPLGLLLGFAYLATGVLGFAFFWVSSMISRELKDIRRLLLTYPLAALQRPFYTNDQKTEDDTAG